MSILVFFLLTFVAQPSPSYAQEHPPRDGEIRTMRAADRTVTTLTLMLRGPSGALPINLVLGTSRLAQARPTTPSEVSMEFQMGRFVGSLDYKAPHYVLHVDPGMPDGTNYSATVSAGNAIQAVSRFNVPFDLVQLSRLSRARDVDGQVFGVKFALTPSQVRAISDFSVRALHR